MPKSRVLNNRYQIDELIGRGGMADVYKGLDQLLHRPVAVKMLRTELARDPQFQARFRREAKSSASLNHPSIVAVYDTGTETMQDNELHTVECPFIVMEYLQGQTLRDLLDGGPLPLEDAVTYTCGVLEALAYAHEKEIVHRDIKPSNVMVCDNGDVKVMDFGIARALADSGATMTQTSAVVGTAQYLSPEQARGDDVDTRSDLYSAGCLLFELLTGRPPFVGDSPVAVAYQHVSEKMPTASGLNPKVTDQLDAVLEKAMAKDREKRFQTADEFAEALISAHKGTYAAAAATDGDDQDDDAATQAFSPVGAAGIAGAAGAAGIPAAMAASAEYPATPDEPEDDVDETPHGYEPVAYAEPESQQRSRFGRIMAGTLLGLALLFGLGLGGYFLIDFLNEQRAAAARIEIPDVENKPQNEAQNILMDAGFRPNVKEEFDDEIKAGLAIGTAPAAGDTLPTNSEISLLISKGPEQVTIPKDLEGKSEATVRDKLNELGLTVENVDQVDSATVARDRLMSTNPALGSKVKVGSSVDLTLSSGQVKVPSVVGLSLEDATKKLEAKDVGLNVEAKYNETDEAVPGTVYEQDKTAGDSVDQGSTVTVTIAVAPPKPTPTPSPSPTDDDDDDDDESESPSPSPSESKKKKKKNDD
ncbi:Stk1 family PASTA domain-containing Ser/Thr kinase [Micrococcoides hystricis]|uniref:non-specific serine/threonine protein kinase n=1 Tax=Micrococcoides hystricis TaxID=1572761 RepID=A0ABV6PCV9_9MICC